MSSDPTLSIGHEPVSISLVGWWRAWAAKPLVGRHRVLPFLRLRVETHHSQSARSKRLAGGLGTQEAAAFTGRRREHTCSPGPPSPSPPAPLEGSLQDDSMSSPDSLLIWVLADEVRPGLCHFPRKMPLSAGAMGQVETGQEEHQSEIPRMPAGRDAGNFWCYKIRKWREIAGRKQGREPSFCWSHCWHGAQAGP